MCLRDKGLWHLNGRSTSFLASWKVGKLWGNNDRLVILRQWHTSTTDTSCTWISYWSYEKISELLLAIYFLNPFHNVKVSHAIHPQWFFEMAKNGQWPDSVDSHRSIQQNFPPNACLLFERMLHPAFLKWSCNMKYSCCDLSFGIIENTAWIFDLPPSGHAGAATQLVPRCIVPLIQTHCELKHAENGAEQS